jgi:hypothetical protein
MPPVVDRNVVMQRVTVFQAPTEVMLRPSLYRMLSGVGY